jgi:hypothetical protein
MQTNNIKAIFYLGSPKDIKSADCRITENSKLKKKEKEKEKIS